MGLPPQVFFPTPQPQQDPNSPDAIWGQVPTLRNFMQYAAMADAIRPFVPQQVPNSPDMDPSSIGASLSGGNSPASQGPRGGLKHGLATLLSGFARGVAQPYEEEQARLELLKSQTQAMQAEAAFRTSQSGVLLNPPDRQPQEGATVETGAGTFQWNPDSRRYDIPVGPPKNAVGKTPQEQLFSSLLAKGLTPEQAFTHLQQLTAKEQKPDTPEQQFLDEFQRTHPNATIADALKAYSAITQKPDRTAGDRVSARADKSYQYNAGVLDKVGSPIEQAIGRMGRLQETLHAATPQADALVAPELLTVMAGGQGSGLRMNEAEISRIVGGRSNFESLKATLAKWSTDPTKANSITPAQRAQINSLVEAVNNKLLAKQRILDDARNALLDTEDPIEHRRIVNSARQKLTSVDEQSGTQTTPRVSAPAGMGMSTSGSHAGFSWR